MLSIGDIVCPLGDASDNAEYMYKSFATGCKKDLDLHIKRGADI